MTQTHKINLKVSSKKRWSSPEGGVERQKLSELRTIKLDYGRVLDLYSLGRSMRDIGDEMGVSADTVCRFMRSHGIEPRRRGKSGHPKREASHNWKGDKAGYQAMHMRLRREKGMPRICVECMTTNPNLTYDWANLTGRYGDITDYSRMCRSCHRKYDSARRCTSV